MKLVYVTDWCLISSEKLGVLQRLQTRVLLIIHPSKSKIKIKLPTNWYTLASTKINLFVVERNQSLKEIGCKRLLPIQDIGQPLRAFSLNKIFRFFRS